MEEKRIKYLLEQYQNDQLTASERDELLQLTISDNAALIKSELLAAITANAQFPEVEDKEVTDAAFRDIMNTDKYSVPPVHRIHFLQTNWFRYAAAVLILMAGMAAFLFLNNQPQKQTIVQQSTQKPEMLPGGNKAVLTLADGSTIVLDSAANGSLAQQGNSNVVKSGNGWIRYENQNNDQPNESAIAYNTIATPNGGQYQVLLPDGSKVWLNAASSIRFPTAFSNDRKVTVTGEVYLEIAKDKKRPFYVSANGTEVQVLGTSFNVNTYPEEETTQVTLLQGLVSVSEKNHSGPVILHPGEQAAVTKTPTGQAGAIKLNRNVDTAKVVSWKYVLLTFNDLAFDKVMKKIERLYDVKVVYAGRVPDIKLEGDLSRNTTLHGMLELLKFQGARLRLEGKTIIVD